MAPALASASQIVDAGRPPMEVVVDASARADESATAGASDAGPDADVQALIRRLAQRVYAGVATKGEMEQLAALCLQQHASECAHVLK
jgi:hypothetical protein